MKVPNRSSRRKYMTSHDYGKKIILIYFYFEKLINKYTLKNTFMWLNMATYAT